MLRTDQTVGSSVTKAGVVTVSGVTWTSFVCSHALGYVSHGGGGIAIDWVTQRSRFWQKHLGLMYSQATVYTPRIELCCVGTTPLKGGGYKVDKKPTHRSTSCGNLRRPHWTKTSTVLCCLLLRVAAFLASENTGRPCTSDVVERVPPQGAPYMGAQRYQAINGNEELATQVVTGVTVGWDLMQQLALRLALDSPFQIVLYLSSTAEILSPVRTISSQMAPLDLEVCYLVQKLQYPTAEHYQTLMTALYEKDVIELLYLLGQGIDLTWSVPDGGHTSSLLTLAIFRDNDSDTYKFQASKDLHFPRPGVSLTYLLLQSLANPNILPPKQQPTTMLELAVELGNSHLVQLLLDERAMVHPE